MRMVSAISWIATTLFLSIGGLLLLFACDLNVPLFNSGGKFCPKPAELDVLDGEAARRHDLEIRIHEAELKLAQTPRCAPPPPAPPERAEVSDPPERTEVLVGPQVGARGKLEVTLWWQTKDDLDLMVMCPGGLIKGLNSDTRGPGICGDGILDHDANRKLVNPVSDPVEHIVWQRVIPDGQYEVWAKPSYSFGPAPIKYQVRVEFDGEQKICSGEVYVDWMRKTGIRQRAITFTPRHPLPDCEYLNHTMVLCSTEDEADNNKFCK